MFEGSWRFNLEDGREILLQYEGEEYGWGAYLDWDTDGRGQSKPAEAIALALRIGVEDLPQWIHDLSDRLLRELRNAPRYVCPCCGYRTLLNPGRYEICNVCAWEDDPASEWDGPDAHSGPNHMSLTKARANFATFGATDERAKGHVRDPRPEEHVPKPDADEKR